MYTFPRNRSYEYRESKCFHLILTFLFWKPTEAVQWSGTGNDTHEWESDYTVSDGKIAHLGQFSFFSFISYIYQGFSIAQLTFFRGFLIPQTWKFNFAQIYMYYDLSRSKNSSCTWKTFCGSFKMFETSIWLKILYCISLFNINYTV